MENLKKRVEKSRRLIDFHAHILPRVDHGSRSVEESKKQIEILSSAGIGEIVATPHFYPHKITLDDYLSLRADGVESIKRILSEDSPKVYFGSEVLLTSGLDKMPGLEKLCIDGTNVILIELPLADFDRDLAKTLKKIKESGFCPVVAHIDRYTIETIEALAFLEVGCQVNADAFLASQDRRRVREYISEGIVCAIGTDIHGESSKYAKNYKKACSFLKQDLDDIMESSKELLKGAKAI